MVWLKRIAFIVSGLVIGIGAGFALFRQSGMFRVNEIPVRIVNEKSDSASIAASETDAKTEVEGLSEDLETRLESVVKNFAGRKIWEIDMDRLVESIRADQWVQAVHVSRSFPDNVEIKVTPKTAVFLFADEKGRFASITSDGALITDFSAARLPDVPVLRGERFFNDEKLRRRAIEFSEKLPDQGPFRRENISEVAWSNEDGFSVFLLEPRVKVILGEDRVELKVARVAQVLDYMSAHQLKGRVIDASFTKKVLVRLRKGP
jgi:cell division septal protein FtsQ